VATVGSMGKGRASATVVDCLRREKVPGLGSGTACRLKRGDETTPISAAAAWRKCKTRETTWAQGTNKVISRQLDLSTQVEPLLESDLLQHDPRSRRDPLVRATLHRVKDGERRGALLDSV
jgi:hypothetical protein